MPSQKSKQRSQRSDGAAKEGYTPADEAVDGDPVHTVEPGVFQFPELNGTMVCSAAQSDCIAVGPCTDASVYGTGSSTTNSATAVLEQDARLRGSRSRDSELSSLFEMDETDSSSPESAPAVRRNPGSDSQTPPQTPGSLRNLRRLSTSANQTFPKHTFRFGSPTPLRPEDVDTSVLRHDDPHGCSQAKAEASLELGKLHRKRNGVDEPLLGVGPAGVIPQANVASFAAASYAPEAVHVAGEAAMTGHDSFRPGQLPWYVFRSAVLLIMVLWCYGLLWAVAQALHLPDIPVKVLPEQIVVASDEAKGAEWYFTKVQEEASKLIPASRQIQIEWPDSHFRPTGVSCDATRNIFAFSDDFQIFFGAMRQKADSAVQVASLNLARPCEPLEGMAMDDIAIHCSTGSHICSAFVLHGQGSKITECSLEAWPSEGDGDPSQADEQQSCEWELQRNWLQDVGFGRERMVSLAIDQECNQSKGLAEGQMTSRFVPKDRSCVVVGTNHGRIVTLAQRPGHKHQMVPTGALWNALGMHRETEQATVESSSNLQMVSGSRLLILHDQMRRVKVVYTDLSWTAFWSSASKRRPNRSAESFCQRAHRAS